MQKEANKQSLNMDIAILPISAISEALDVHQRTLRIYDKQGILSPKRSDKNRRHYSLKDFEKAKLVLFLTRNLALNLAGVKIILAILEDKNINPQEYIDYIERIAKLANIDSAKQETNIQKTSKRGRKAKNQKEA